MTDLNIRLLDETTWPDFEKLVHDHNGIWGGCWCMSFHSEGIGRGKTPEQNRLEKKQRVSNGRAHAALVYHGSAAVGWCQFGSTDELPRIKNKRAYSAATPDLPDWRITCFFVDRNVRRTGVASAALRGALTEIARLGGGTVESYPDDIRGSKTSSSFLHNGTVEMFEREGFRRTSQIGKTRWVVRKEVAASTQ